jgi:hypothetical protein
LFFIAIKANTRLIILSQTRQLTGLEIWATWDKQHTAQQQINPMLTTMTNKREDKYVT